MLSIIATYIGIQDNSKYKDTESYSFKKLVELCEKENWIFEIPSDKVNIIVFEDKETDIFSISVSPQNYNYVGLDFWDLITIGGKYKSKLISILENDYNISNIIQITKLVENDLDTERG